MSTSGISATNSVNGITISISGDADEILNSDTSTAMTNNSTGNVMITQDSIETDTTSASTGRIPLLSQDTISTVEFDGSEHHDNMNSDDTNNSQASQRQEVVPVRMAVDETVAPTTQPAFLSPPPLIVQCPNVNDVLFPMEGFTMWPGNIYCNNILRQHQSQFTASSDSKEHQALILLEIVQKIQSQQSSNRKDDDRFTDGCGRFLKAIQVPNRNNQQHQNLKPTKNDLQSHTVENSSGDAMLSKTIWEVMYESDVLIQLSKILVCYTKTNRTMNDDTMFTTHNDESQISSSAMAILQGLYYVPNYYPTRTDKRPHEYDSCDEDESVVSYYSSSEDNENEAMSMKKRRVIHRTEDDFKPTTSKSSVVSNNDRSTDTSSSRTNPTKKSVTSQNVRLQQQPPPSAKVSMIGRITVADEELYGGPIPVAASITTTTTTTTSTTSSSTKNNSNINNSDHKINFQYRHKSMKSHQAMIEQEGSDNLPKGVTVRPSGKWQAQTYFAGQSRYVGVYDNSRLAARAYNVVQAYLRKYRIECKITKDTPKDELTAVFGDARRLADEAVQRLRRDLNMNDGVVDETGDEPIDTIDIQTSSVSPSTVNVGTQLTEPPLDTVSTVDSTSQPIDDVEQDLASRDPAISASAVDSSTP